MHIDEAISRLNAETLSRDDFLRELQITELAVPLGTAVDGGSSLSVFSYGSHSCAAVFTEPKRVVEAYVGRPVAALTGRQLAEQWSTDLALSLNPTEQGPGLMIPGGEVQRMASDELRRVVPTGSRTVVGAPAIEPPPALRDVVAKLVRVSPGIKCAYLFEMGIETQQPELVLGIVVADGETVESVLPAAAQWMSTHYSGQGALDLLPLAGSLLETVAEYVPAISGA